MREFERTGIYPEYLLFNLPGTRQSWKVRIKQKPQEGVLDGEWCKFREIKSDGSFSEWKNPDGMIIEMRD